MKWKVGEGYPVKPHVLPDTLVDKISESLTNRGIGFIKGIRDLEQHKVHLDLGGSVFTNEPIIEAYVDDLEVTVFAIHHKWFLKELLNGPLRTDAELPYYKLHGKYCCLCITPEQRDILLKEWQDAAEEAEDLARESVERFEKIAEELASNPNVKVVSKLDIN